MPVISYCVKAPKRVCSEPVVVETCIVALPIRAGSDVVLLHEERSGMGTGNLCTV